MAAVRSRRVPLAVDEGSANAKLGACPLCCGCTGSGGGQAEDTGGAETAMGSGGGGGGAWVVAGAWCSCWGG